MHIVPLYLYKLALDLTISSVLSPLLHHIHLYHLHLGCHLEPNKITFETFSNSIEFSLPLLDSFNAYAQISSRALRQSLKETARLNAEKRGLTDLRFQKWENGNGGPQVCPILVHPYASLQK